MSLGNPRWCVGHFRLDRRGNFGVRSSISACSTETDTADSETGDSPSLGSPVMFPRRNQSENFVGRLESLGALDVSFNF